MSRAEKRAFSPHGRAQGSPVSVSEAAEILIDLCARAVFGTHHQRPNPLRHSFLKKLPKLSLANQELLPERAEHLLELPLKFQQLLIGMPAALPLSADKFYPSNGLVHPRADRFVAAPAGIISPGDRDTRQPALHSGNSALLNVPDERHVVSVIGEQPSVLRSGQREDHELVTELLNHRPLRVSHLLVTGLPHPFQLLTQLRAYERPRTIELLGEMVGLLAAPVLRPLVFRDVIQPGHRHGEHDRIVRALVRREQQAGEEFAGAEQVRG